MDNKTLYPEHEKLDRAEEFQAIKNFCEFLDENYCEVIINGRVSTSETLMYKYFGVDKKALELERRHMLKSN